MNNKDVSKMSAFEGLVNNPYISNYAIKTETMGEVTKPKPTSRQDQLYTVQDVKKFLQDHPLKFKPLGDRVICIELARKENESGFNMTDSGIILNGGNNSKIVHGRLGERQIEEEHKWSDYVVVAVAEGFMNSNGTRTPMEVKQWDVVRLGHWIGYLQDINNIEVKIARDSDCTGTHEV